MQERERQRCLVVLLGGPRCGHVEGRLVEGRCELPEVSLLSSLPDFKEYEVSPDVLVDADYSKGENGDAKCNTGGTGI